MSATALIATPLSQPLIDLATLLAPYCGILCFLAPLPTIRQISQTKTTNSLPLLPYSSMIANCFVWVCYGLLKGVMEVWGSNLVGFILGGYYCWVFTRILESSGKSTDADNLPGTVGMHARGVAAILVFNVIVSFVFSKDVASDFIGKEGVFFCIVLFASPLAALKHVIVTKSAASIPLPFTVACTINCSMWLIMGVWKMNDFNIYFPNFMGLTCALAQLALKGYYGSSKVKVGLPK